MSRGIGELLSEFHEVAERAQTLAFLARAKELQERMVNELATYLDSLAERKRAAVEQSDELAANTLLSMELAIEVVREQLLLYVALKDDLGESAWAHLVHAQKLCKDAVAVRRQLRQGHEVAGLQTLFETLEIFEKLFFPPQVFVSIGGRATSRECTICLGDYAICDHVKGRAYMGRLCVTIIRKLTPEEVSIVTNPANKLARATHFPDAGGMRNTMTWRLEKR